MLPGAEPAKRNMVHALHLVVAVVRSIYELGRSGLQGENAVFAADQDIACEACKRELLGLLRQLAGAHQHAAGTTH